jgi:hypothetical protein
LSPAVIFDGGDLDCGSGLILLIRENMLRTPVGDILEMRSREPTVAEELPPWCRMVGHVSMPSPIPRFAGSVRRTGAHRDRHVGGLPAADLHVSHPGHPP